jgi:hypothetical protein
MFLDDTVPSPDEAVLRLRYNQLVMLEKGQLEILKENLAAPGYTYIDSPP